MSQGDVRKPIQFEKGPTRLIGDDPVSYSNEVERGIGYAAMGGRAFEGEEVLGEMFAIPIEMASQDPSLDRARKMASNLHQALLVCVRNFARLDAYTLVRDVLKSPAVLKLVRDKQLRVYLCDADSEDGCVAESYRPKDAAATASFLALVDPDLDDPAMATHAIAAWPSESVQPDDVVDVAARCLQNIRLRRGDTLPPEVESGDSTALTALLDRSEEDQMRAAIAESLVEDKKRKLSRDRERGEWRGGRGENDRKDSKMEGNGGNVENSTLNHGIENFPAKNEPVNENENDKSCKINHTDSNHYGDGIHDVNDDFDDYNNHDDDDIEESDLDSDDDWIQKVDDYMEKKKPKLDGGDELTTNTSPGDTTMEKKNTNGFSSPSKSMPEIPLFSKLSDAVVIQIRSSDGMAGPLRLSLNPDALLGKLRDHLRTLFEAPRLTIFHTSPPFGEIVEVERSVRELQLNRTTLRVAMNE